ncbi:hypothetical protein L208DRAFT_325524 [Tricholoma matsutake]|nr:hypothetical protein L208DRAFT_325524 [Tricholoma matsutake 945]
MQHHSCHRIVLSCTYHGSTNGLEHHDIPIFKLPSSASRPIALAPWIVPRLNASSAVLLIVLSILPASIYL